MNIDEFERKAKQAREECRQVVLDPEEVEDAAYWIRSFLRQRDYWVKLYTDRRAWRIKAFIQRNLRSIVNFLKYGP